MIQQKDCFVFEVAISFYLCNHRDTNKSVKWMHNQTPSLITSFHEQKQGNRGGGKKQAKVIQKAELYDKILSYALQTKFPNYLQ